MNGCLKVVIWIKVVRLLVKTGPPRTVIYPCGGKVPAWINAGSRGPVFIKSLTTLIHNYHHLQTAIHHENFIKIYTFLCAINGRSTFFGSL